jgi:hypothetical protein
MPAWTSTPRPPLAVIEMGTDGAAVDSVPDRVNARLRSSTVSSGLSEAQFPVEAGNFFALVRARIRGRSPNRFAFAETRGHPWNGGARVVLCARDAAALAEVRGAIEAAGGKADVLPLDLRQPDAPAQLAAFAIEQTGRIDLPIDNAGTARRGEFEALTDAEWADRLRAQVLRSDAADTGRVASPEAIPGRGTVHLGNWRADSGRSSPLAGRSTPRSCR